MDRQYIHDHQVIERYLRGALTPNEEKRFEEAYLADPDLLAEIELVEHLRQGLKSHGADARQQVRGSAAPTWLRIMTSPQYAAAASVLLAVAVVFAGALYRENLSLRSTPSFAAVPTRTIPLLTVRGDGGTVVPAAERNDVLTLFALDPGAPEYDTYRATIRRVGSESPEMVARIDGLTIGYLRTVDVGVPERALTAGDYEFELEGRMNDWAPERAYEPASRIPFTIEARE
jgi:hypothetical protein